MPSIEVRPLRVINGRPPAASGPRWWVRTVLRSTALGLIAALAAAFIANFAAVITLLILQSLSHRPADFRIAFMDIAPPAAIAVFVLVTFYFVRRAVRDQRFR